jgi:NADH-quinone oxidoreductase subunit F
MDFLDKKIVVTTGTCGISAGADTLIEEFSKNKVNIKKTGCIGLCAIEPTVFIFKNGVTLFKEVLKKDVKDIIDYFKNDILSKNLEKKIYFKGPFKDLKEKVFKGQTRLILRNVGLIDPFNIDDYIKLGGYQFLKKCINKKIKKEDIISILKSSGLRGRGGAGFPTFKKWELLKKERSKEKYIICNADEGDPGAFMDRSLLEGDPHSVLEGIQIASFATGATKAFIYIRAEYPLAVKTIKNAIREAKEKELLIVNTEIRQGAGAFVCGEETALIASIEGKRGMPRKRPPYPSASGVFGKPTNINNVETLAAVSWIMQNPGAYEKYGYKKSLGTKVFALAGNIKRGGLVEIEFGRSLNDLIYTVGFGIKDDKILKAIQLGGPSGGCLPKAILDTKIDYESLKETGAIVGSGGVVVMDESSCMVDIAKFFMKFNASESCGKCTFCRVGTSRILEILEKISDGFAKEEDLEKLYDLAKGVSMLSLCGLGKTSPNPVLTTLKYFKDEYLEHIENKVCKTHVCKNLIRYSINENCVKCLACVKTCPVNAISEISEKLEINQSKCIKCGKCFSVCKFKAVSVK